MSEPLTGRLPFDAALALVMSGALVLAGRVPRPLRPVRFRRLPERLGWLAGPVGLVAVFVEWLEGRTSRFAPEQELMPSALVWSLHWLLLAAGALLLAALFERGEDREAVNRLALLMLLAVFPASWGSMIGVVVFALLLGRVARSALRIAATRAGRRGARWAIAVALGIGAAGVATIRIHAALGPTLTFATAAGVTWLAASTLAELERRQRWVELTAALLTGLAVTTIGAALTAVFE